MLNDAVREAAAGVWLVRERTEHEASALFSRLAADLDESGAPDALVALARRSADDETVHAEHCREVVDSLVPGLPSLRPDLDVGLGSPGMGAHQRALYSSVALGCITESLSTALLLEMRSEARGVVRSALDVILRDEVRHSRLGWAHLAWASTRVDVGWLGSSVRPMLAAAIDEEVSGAVRSDEDRQHLAQLGILAPEAIRRIASATVETTIAPGLRRFGIAA